MIDVMVFRIFNMKDSPSACSGMKGDVGRFRGRGRSRVRWTPNVRQPEPRFKV